MPLTTNDILPLTFYLFAGVQLLYWLYFIIGLSRLKSASTVPNEAGLSVVVAAQNEIHNLRILLPKLRDQQYEKFEIIIVNDRSEDGTLEYLVEEEKNIKNLKALHIHERPEHINGKKYALTLGIKAAKYEKVNQRCMKK